MVQLNFSYLKSRPAFEPEDVRMEIYRRIAEVVGPLSTKSLIGFPAFAAVKLNDANVRRSLVAIMRDIAAAAS